MQGTCVRVGCLADSVIGTIRSSMTGLLTDLPSSHPAILPRATESLAAQHHFPSLPLPSSSHLAPGFRNSHVFAGARTSDQAAGARMGLASAFPALPGIAKTAKSKSNLVQAVNGAVLAVVGRDPSLKARVWIQS